MKRALAPIIGIIGVALAYLNNWLWRLADWCAYKAMYLTGKADEWAPPKSKHFRIIK